MPDKIIFEDQGITIELPTEPASVVDLAKVILECRKASSFGKSKLSDNAVCKLLETAFYLSMRSDEGRFPHLRITSGEKKDGRLTIKLETPIAFSDVHELRRITPVAESPEFAILVTESVDGELLCLGLANIGHLGHGSLPGRLEIVSVGGPPSLKIWIEGPGHFFVSEGGTCFEYRAGRVRLVYPALSYVPKLRELTQNVGQVLHQRAIESVKDISGADRYFGGCFGVTSIISVMLRKLLDTCLELRHGGAFLILPQEGRLSTSYGISCKYSLEAPDLGEDIVNYWSRHIIATYRKKQGVEEYDRELRHCHGSKARLLNNIDAVAHLSAADGCVVLSNTFRVLGFGGSILVSEEECKKTSTKVRFSTDQSCSIDEFLNNVGGQRHQSAARLAIKHSDVMIFVISQDGELSVFASDKEGYVRVYRPVDPSYSPDSN